MAFPLLRQVWLNGVFNSLFPLQILEYNSTDLRAATAEQAAYELAKPAMDKVAILVQYNPDSESLKHYTHI